jgi:ankyrin repeat protein
MEQIEEMLSPAVRHELGCTHYGQLALTDGTYTDRRSLVMRARQRLAAAQDLHTLENIQTLQRLVCMPSREQETDWQLAVEGDTELHTVIRKKDTDMLEALLQQSQADINTHNKRGDTPLLLAAQTGMGQYYTHTLLGYPLNVDAKNAAGFTALYYAIKKNDCGCMRLLLKHGADTSFVDEDGNTLLHIVAQSDAFHAAGKLAFYKCKLNPNQLNRYGLAPLHIAMLKNFKNEGTTHSILWDAGAYPDTPMAGESPLIFAIRNELMEVINDLLKKGADANAKDAMGNSALDLALTRRYNTAIMDELLRYGAKPDIKDAEGNTPLARALNNDDIDAASTLIAYGADPNTPGANGIMPIFHALRLKELHCAAKMVEHEANIHVRDAEGNTPLHFAVEFENLVSVLISRGADIGAVNIHGDTPLHCIENMTPISAYVLRLYGADINLKNNDGLTPYEKAVSYCRRVRYLDGRLLRILEPAGSYKLLGWLSGARPKTSSLASAREYGITLADLPGIQAEDTRSVGFVVPGQDSRIECVDDNGEQAAAVAQAPEEPAHTQEPQPRGNLSTHILRTGGQIGTKFWKRTVACFCPWTCTATQSLESAPPAASPEPAPVSPVVMTDEALAPATSAQPQKRADSLLHFDDPSSDNTCTIKQRFLAHSQP